MNYCATRKKLLAIIKSTDHFHKYLYGRKFLIRADHTALSWLLRLKNPDGPVTRWMERLQHRPDRNYNNAGGISRRPCGKCKRVEECRCKGIVIEQSEECAAENVRNAQQEVSGIGSLLKWKEDNIPLSVWKDMSPECPTLKTMFPSWNFCGWRVGSTKGVRNTGVRRGAWGSIRCPLGSKQDFDKSSRAILLGTLPRIYRKIVSHLCTYQGSNNTTNGNNEAV